MKIDFPLSKSEKRFCISNKIFVRNRNFDSNRTTKIQIVNYFNTSYTKRHSTTSISIRDWKDASCLSSWSLKTTWSCSLWEELLYSRKSHHVIKMSSLYMKSSSPDQNKTNEPKWLIRKKKRQNRFLVYSSFCGEKNEAV